MLKSYRYSPGEQRDARGRWTRLSGAADRAGAAAHSSALADEHEGLRAAASGVAASHHRATAALARLQATVNGTDHSQLGAHTDAAKAAVTALRIQAHRLRTTGQDATAADTAHEHYNSQLKALQTAARAGHGADVVHHLGTAMGGGSAPAPVAPSPAPAPAPAPAAPQAAPSGAAYPPVVQAAVARAANAAHTLLNAGRADATAALGELQRHATNLRTLRYRTQGAERDAAVEAHTMVNSALGRLRGGAQSTPEIQALLAHRDAGVAAPAARVAPAPVPTAAPAAPAPVTPAPAAPAAPAPTSAPAPTWDETPFPLADGSQPRTVSGFASTPANHRQLASELRTRAQGSSRAASMEASATAHEALAQAQEHLARGEHAQAASALDDATRAYNTVDFSRVADVQGAAARFEAGFQTAEHGLQQERDRRSTPEQRAARLQAAQAAQMAAQAQAAAAAQAAAQAAQSTGIVRGVAPALRHYNYQTEAPTGQGFHQGASPAELISLNTVLRNLGRTPDEQQRALQKATGCATFGEFKKRVLGDHPKLDHGQTHLMITGGTHSLSVTAELNDSRGKKLGTMTRNLNHSSSRPSVYNAYLKLNKRAQKYGMATSIYQSQEEAWKAAGYKQVNITANIDVGGYAWAVHGFDFASPSDLAGRQRILKGHIDSLQRAGKLPPDVAEAHRQAVARTSHAWEVARFKINHPGLTDDEAAVGKTTMLGSFWGAVRQLDDQWPGNIVSNDTRARGFQRAAAALAPTRGRRAAPATP